MTREATLVTTLVQLADALVADFDVVDLLTVLTDCCTGVLDVAAAGIMLVDSDGEMRVVASSSDTMRGLELFEVQAREGPCIDCYRTGRPVANVDLTLDDRWPRLKVDAVAAGFRSMYALPMRLRGVVIGALNLFRTQPGELVPENLEAAQALADVATITILQHRAALEAQTLNDQLNHALDSRILIEQAKGMIAERLDCNMEKAIATLRNHARNHNVRLMDLAGSVIAGVVLAGALDLLPSRRR